MQIGNMTLLSLSLPITCSEKVAGICNPAAAGGLQLFFSHRGNARARVLLLPGFTRRRRRRRCCRRRCSRRVVVSHVVVVVEGGGLVTGGGEKDAYRHIRHIRPIKKVLEWFSENSGHEKKKNRSINAKNSLCCSGFVDCIIGLLL
jgi:hypothetical protein